MKKPSHKIFTKRKILAIFLLAIFLPTVIVGFLSVGTFIQRRDAVQKLLESNRWIAGETAVNSLENGLVDYEIENLKPGNFNLLLQPSKSDSASSTIRNENADHFFLLDTESNVIFPRTGNNPKISDQPGKIEAMNLPSRNFQKAESLEFSQKNYIGAAEMYKACFSPTLTIQERASLLEREGRCLLLAKCYKEAETVYKELLRDYDQIFNSAGHPYGLVAAFQLYEVSRGRNSEEQALKMLLDLYKKIGDGSWLVNGSIFDFYRTEIETILNDQLKDGRFPKIRKLYSEQQKQESPYRKQLAFSDFLHQSVIPGIKDKLDQYLVAEKSGRIMLRSDSGFTLVSYAILPDFKSGQSGIGGFCWDSFFLQNQLIPKILKDIEKDSGLDIHIVDEKGANILTGQENLGSNASLMLNFRQFPFPWKLVATYSGINTLEGTSNRELIFFGVLLIVILLLMLLGAVLIIRDITREAETTRLKTEFVHTISHELKTPLTLIRLYGETLQRKGNLTEAEKNDCYEIITKESERLTHLINNVLDFSRIEMGRKEFDFKVGNLAEIVEETLEAYRYHLGKKGFTVYKEITSDLPEMSFDADAMASVLINLLSNAMKFSLLDKEVTVKLFALDENVILQVIDKGIGIPKADFIKIFQRFYQSENKQVSERRGSGLGLTLVKHITEAHHGTVRVESKIGQGSTFSISIPLKEKAIGC